MLNLLPFPCEFTSHTQHSASPFRLFRMQWWFFVLKADWLILKLDLRSRFCAGNTHLDKRVSAMKVIFLNGRIVDFEAVLNDGDQLGLAPPQLGF